MHKVNNYRQKDFSLICVHDSKILLALRVAAIGRNF